MSTGSIESEEFHRTTNTADGFDGHENDTLNRTNTFPFDVLFDDYHEYYEVVSQLQKFANDYPDIVEIYTLTDIIPAGETWQGNEIIGITKIQKITNSMVFLICHLKCKGKLIATASGIWKILKKSLPNAGYGG